MAGLMTELIDTLDEYADCCEKLLAFAEQKRGVIVRNETDLLRDIVARENELVGKAQRMEKRRAALFDDIAVVLNQPKDGLTLGGLRNIAEGQPESLRLNEVSERLQKALDALRAANEGNRALIENALDYIEFSINVLRTTFVDENQDYQESGKGVDIKN